MVSEFSAFYLFIYFNSLLKFLPFVNVSMTWAKSFVIFLFWFGLFYHALDYYCHTIVIEY